MRHSVVLRLVSAAALALVAGSVTVSPASAFVGLSDKQANEIARFIKCETYLLKGDLVSFEADPDCGKGPVAVEYLGAGGGGGGYVRHHHECDWEWPSDGPSFRRPEGEGDCYPEID